MFKKLLKIIGLILIIIAIIILLVFTAGYGGMLAASLGISEGMLFAIAVGALIIGIVISPEAVQTIMKRVGTVLGAVGGAIGTGIGGLLSGLGLNNIFGWVLIGGALYIGYNMYKDYKSNKQQDREIEALENDNFLKAQEKERGLVNAN